MNALDARRIVLDALGQVAPEADLDLLASDEDVADELDLDSIDFLNVVTAISHAIGFDIPEREYARLTTLDDLIAYVMAVTVTPTAGPGT
jgi:acyl carrier protein